MDVFNNTGTGLDYEHQIMVKARGLPAKLHEFTKLKKKTFDSQLGKS
jgi:hypothetical protein